MLFYAVASEHLGPQVLAAFAPKHFAPRILFTVYPFVEDYKHRTLLPHVLKAWHDRQLICDSGIFTLNTTLLAISEKERVKKLQEYSEKYREVLRAAKYPGVYVDLDCQRLVPIPEYKKIRAPFMKDAENCIFVWHPQSGLDGLKEMVRKCRRLAFSARDMKELARLKDKKMRVEQVALSLLRAAGGDKHTHHVHLLGTSMEPMFAMPDNWSCDSVSWSAVAFWGRSHSGIGSFEVAEKRGRLFAPTSIKKEVTAHMGTMMRAYRDSPEYRHKNPIRKKYIRTIAAGLWAQQLIVRSWRYRYNGNDAGCDPLTYVNQQPVEI